MSDATQVLVTTQSDLLRKASCLPIIELDKTDVQTDYKRIRMRSGSLKRARAQCSFGDFTGSLNFNAWSFFHAAKKTELTSSFTTELIDRRAIGFSEDYNQLFVWNTPNLRRVDRSVFALEDFAGSGLAGRCGEAIACLTMAQWGYAFWDRIAVLWERAAANSGMTHPEMVKLAKVISSKTSSRPDLEPDFAFEKATSEVAMMEAKGSFVHPIDDSPSTKDDLRHGLDQLNAWSEMIVPAPQKSFVIGTYFRDASDTTGDPSLIAFVDPVGANDASGLQIELPSDWIRRGNYGAWLNGMGFSATGNALRNGRQISPPEQELPILRFGERDYAVTFQRVVIKQSRARRLPRFAIPWWEPGLVPDELWHHPRIIRELGIVGIQVMSIDIGVLELIERAVTDSASSSLMDIDVGDMLAQDSTTDGLMGSIFPDRTLFGTVAPEVLANAGTRVYRL